MTLSLGVNLRVTGHCNQGGRKYMEDVFSVAYQQTSDEKDLEYAFFGIFDGHGGREAAQYSKDHIMDAITKNKLFWSEDDDSVLKAIREGFLSTQQAMWNELPKWKKTATGLPSTAGTTASVCFIKRGKLFIGHVGDSGIILGERDPTHPSRWRAKPLTREHKPESECELARIEAAGGKVMTKSGVHRVVWYRPSNGASHQGPVRRSTNFDEIPFLAVARALGDLWSYNSEQDEYVVSPDPDLRVFDLNVLKDRCLVLATDGAWNVLSPDMAVEEVFSAERNNEKHMIDPQGGHTWVNPSKRLVDIALDRWNSFKLRADNTSIVTVMLDPPGPPRAQVLRRLYGLQSPKPYAETQQTKFNNTKQTSNSTEDNLSESQSNKDSNYTHEKKNIEYPEAKKASVVDNYVPNGNDDSAPNLKNLGKEKENTPKAKISEVYEEIEDAGAVAKISRFPNSKENHEQVGWNVVESGILDKSKLNSKDLPSGARVVHDSVKTVPSKMKIVQPRVPSYLVHPPPPLRKTKPINSIDKSSMLKFTRDTASDVEETPSSTSNVGAHISSCTETNGQHKHLQVSSPLQINQVTSSDDESTPPPLPQRPPGGHGAIHKKRGLCRELQDLQNNATSMVSGSGVIEHKSVIPKIIQESANSDIRRTTRSRLSGSMLENGNSMSGSTKPVISIPSSNTSENDALPNTDNLLSKRPQRRSILMPSTERANSPTYNSDSENLQPSAHQLRSRENKRSLSVPQQMGKGYIGNSSRRDRASSYVGEKKNGEYETVQTGLLISSNASRNESSSMVKLMAVNIGTRNGQISEKPPPLPARTSQRSSCGQPKILQPTDIHNPIEAVSKSLPSKQNDGTPSRSSPRVLRPRNTPSTFHNSQPPVAVNDSKLISTPNRQQQTAAINSKVISTPNHRISVGRDSGKTVPSKITSRTVKFFEDNIKTSNETGSKRKRRSFDALGHTMPINKSAKLIRAANTTRSCTWNTPNKSKTSKYLCSKNQATRDSK